MQYCPKCKVKIRGDKKSCPLCGEDIQGTPEKDVFPDALRTARRFSLVKLLTFIAVCGVIVMLCVFYITRAKWPLITALLLAVAWIDAMIGVYFRYNIVKLITVQTYIGMAICLIIDMKTGFIGWSVFWVIPGAFVALFIATFLIALLSKLRIEDVVIYLVFDAVVGLFQIIPVVTGQNSFPLPALFSAAALFIAAAALFLFRFRDLKNASGKWFST